MKFQLLSSILSILLSSEVTTAFISNNANSNPSTTGKMIQHFMVATSSADVEASASASVTSNSVKYEQMSLLTQSSKLNRLIRKHLTPSSAFSQADTMIDPTVSPSLSYRDLPN